MVSTGTKWDGILRQLDDNSYVIPRSYKSFMRVDALIVSSPALIAQVCGDLSLEQAANVAALPGILKYSLAMPDMHQGYGFPIGGVAAMGLEDGVVSPGGVGFDINCGVRLLVSSLSLPGVCDKIPELVDRLFEAVPAGTGQGGKVRLSTSEIDRVLTEGSRWAVAQGYADRAVLDHTEEDGCMPDADPQAVSQRAKSRGANQLGTLGSGNHFLEVQYVQKILDSKTADSFGLFPGQLCIMIHCGSRGLGHQVCTDYLTSMQAAMQKYGLEVPDRQLACIPICSPEGKKYLAAMSAAANFAFANRQVISHLCQEASSDVFGSQGRLSLLYDVTHNMAKLEKHRINGDENTVLVHRKGATRAFPAGRPELSGPLKSAGQPVIIPGDMGRASYVLVGTEAALERSFGSVCHGAGRLMSRTQARRGRRSQDVVRELKKKGIIARSTSREGLTEEVPEAYKPIDAVIEAVSAYGLARPVARLKPVGVVKG